MSDTEPTRMEPPVSRVSTPYWEATRDRRLVLQHCSSCDRAIWYPRTLCPHCSSTNIDWRPATGLGTIYAVSVQYRPGTPQLSDRVPYAVVLVDLDEGVRVMSNVVGSDPDQVTIGSRVRAAWEPLTDGRNLLLFELAADEPSLDTTT